MWADPVIAAIDGLPFSVRADSPDVTVAIQRLLAEFRTGADGDGPTLSLRRGGGRQFHVVYWGSCPVVRTRDRRRAVTGLLGHLAGHRPPLPGSLRLWGVAAVRDGVAVAVLIEQNQRPRFERPLRAQGWTLVDRPWVDVDPDQAQLIVPPVLEPSRDRVQALIDLLDGDDPEPTVAPGCYELSHLVVAAPGATELSPAERLLSLIGMAREHPPDLGRLAGLASTVRVVAEEDSRTWVPRLIAAVSGQSRP